MARSRKAVRPLDPGVLDYTDLVDAETYMSQAIADRTQAAIPVFMDEHAWLTALKVGDQVHRFLGPVPMLLKVSKVTRDRIVCGAWDFDRATGAEIDEELGWGPGHTGSWIRPISN